MYIAICNYYLTRTLHFISNNDVSSIQHYIKTQPIDPIATTTVLLYMFNTTVTHLVLTSPNQHQLLYN